MLPDYAATLSYLEGLITKPILSREQVGLGRIWTLLEAVGHPERAFATLHVGGTAGKGSTTTIAASILYSAGYRTGRFTSPHLQTHRERIAIDGTPIDQHLWTRMLRSVLPILERMEHNDLPNYHFERASFLEVLWTMACLAFVERQTQCAVVETGMGGRLDPTTANAAKVAVITNVSLDHTDRLGTTVKAIATEKSGLIKPGQIVISAAEDEALWVIQHACTEQQATLWAVGRDGAIQISNEGSRPDSPFSVHTPLHSHRMLRLGLLGAHQRLNAACAIGAIDALTMQTGLVVSPEAVSTGVTEARIPGRLELFEGRPQILLDGAKSPANAASLAKALDDLFPGRRIVLILGMYADKDVQTIAELLCPRSAVTIVTEPPWKERAGSIPLVSDLARLYCPQVEEAPEITAALARAQLIAGPQDLIVVTGSLHLVGAARDLLSPLDETVA